MMAFMKYGDVERFLQRMSERIDVVAPVNRYGEAAFLPWHGEPLALASQNPLVSPVKILLPQHEVLFRYIQDSGRYSFEEPEAKPMLIFGIRPCDLQALKVLDALLGAKPPDQAYFGRRRSTIIVTLNCLEPGKECFCAQIGSGPGAVEGFDLSLTDLGDGCLVESGSTAGVLMIREHPDLFQSLDREEAAPLISKRQRLLESCERTMLERRPRISPESLKRAAEETCWDKAGRECLSCGGCSFICPTCHCFSICDLGVPDGERVRCADSCILSGFSRMTSGANPRKSPGDRLKNWHLDKFVYVPERTGLLGCVGCGRCQRVCLSGIDRFRILEDTEMKARASAEEGEVK